MTSDDVPSAAAVVFPQEPVKFSDEMKHLGNHYHSGYTIPAMPGGLETLVSLLLYTLRSARIAIADVKYRAADEVNIPKRE